MCAAWSGRALEHLGDILAHFEPRAGEAPTAARFCCASDCAFPCNDDVPMIVGGCFYCPGLVCYPKCGCCKKVNYYYETAEVAAAGAPHAVDMPVLHKVYADEPASAVFATPEMARD